MQQHVKCRADFMLEGNKLNPGGFCEVTCGRCRCHVLRTAAVLCKNGTSMHTAPQAEAAVLAASVLGGLSFHAIRLGPTGQSSYELVGSSSRAFRALRAFSCTTIYSWAAPAHPQVCSWRRGHRVRQWHGAAAAAAAERGQQRRRATWHCGDACLRRHHNSRCAAVALSWPAGRGVWLRGQAALRRDSRCFRVQCSHDQHGWYGCRLYGTSQKPGKWVRSDR